MPALTQELMDRLRALVYDSSDLHFSAKKAVFFERRLRERMAVTGMDDPEAYLDLVSADLAELSELVQSLTTNKTFFFRDSAQFRELRDRVWPELIESKNAEVVRSWGTPVLSARDGRHPAMSIRAWSLGCSTGEEAYSVAFTLLDSVRYTRAWEIEVLATDISREVLKKAERGVYGEAAVRELDPDTRDRHMRLTPEGWSVKEPARRIVSFCEGNLKELSKVEGRREMRLNCLGAGTRTLDAAGHFDVIFCRNVMIYFDRTAQQRLVDALFDCLRPGGYLFTGDSEPLHLFSHGFTRSESGDALYYRKPV